MRTRPRCRTLAATLVLLLGLPLAAQKPTAGKPPKASKPGATVDVVFIGNSYTYYHDLPAMVRALGSADKPVRQVTTTMLAPGGFTLAQHWDATGKDAPRDVLKDKRPDFVVLQEQSRMALDNPSQLQQSATKWSELLAKQKVTPVWYMTWARQAEPTAIERIADEYTKAAKTGGGRLAPVGRAWQEALREPGLQLHDADGSHPSPAGSYLAAIVLYATMTGSDVGTFPDKLVVPGDDGKERVLVELPADTGKRLREAAGKVLGAASAATKKGVSGGK